MAREASPGLQSLEALGRQRLVPRGLLRTQTCKMRGGAFLATKPDDNRLQVGVGALRRRVDAVQLHVRASARAQSSGARRGRAQFGQHMFNHAAARANEPILSVQN